MFFRGMSIGVNDRPAGLHRAPVVRAVAAVAVVAALASARVIAGQPDQTGAVEFFEKEIRPLLVEKCHSCHGGKKTRGGLRLTERQAVLEGGNSGPAAVPFKPDESLLVKAIEQRGTLKMPPTGKLANADVARLRRWVALGIPWPETANASSQALREQQRRWWAFQPVQVVAPPAVKDISWPRTK